MARAIPQPGDRLGAAEQKTLWHIGLHASCSGWAPSVGRGLWIARYISDDFSQRHGRPP